MDCFYNAGFFIVNIFPSKNNGSIFNFSIFFVRKVNLFGTIETSKLKNLISSIELKFWYNSKKIIFSLNVYISIFCPCNNFQYILTPFELFKKM